jgi:hypothetical protein
VAPLADQREFDRERRWYTIRRGGAMSNEASRRRARSWKVGALQVATVVALIAGHGASPAQTGRAQSSSDDPCRYATAEAMGRAFGRTLKASKLVNVCQYKGTGTELVVVKVAAGPEGTILRHAKAVSAQNPKEVEKVTTPVGEAYFDSTLPVFIGRVGDREVQIETTIQPTPRDAMIAAGRRIMETIAR